MYSSGKQFVALAMETKKKKEKKGKKKRKKQTLARMDRSHKV